MDHSYDHAIVLGASMSGLMTAAVLARHCKRVTIVERDALDDDGFGWRKGVPHGRHVHGFWPRGMQVLDRLFPGFRAELLAGGATNCDSGSDFIWHQFGAMKLREPVDMPTTLMTRPFLEAHLRRRVRALPGVVLCDETSVESLIASADHRNVLGVRVSTRDGASRELRGDWVIDATGRAGLCGRWLEALGYERASESKVRIDVNYVTRLYERQRASSAQAHLLVNTPPAGKRAGVAFAVEGDRWVVTLAGFVGEQPPDDDASFLAYARSLPLPTIAEIIQHSRPLGEVAKFKFAYDVRRHYERLTRFPRGLLVTGDALASFNPAYGQGMTVAALEAEALDREFAARGDPGTLARRFFRQAAKIIDVAWSLTTGEDLRFPEVAGPRPAAMRWINAYVVRLHRAAALDAEVCRAFFRVAGFEARPESLFAPRIVWRVLRAGSVAAPLPASIRVPDAAE